MTNQQGVPEALRLADALEFRTTSWPDKVFAAAELRRLHAENERLAALVDAQQPAPSAAAASKAVLAAIRAANMQLVRTGDDEFMLVTLKQATPQADSQPAPMGQNESAYQRGYMDGMAKGRREAEAGGHAAPQPAVQQGDTEVLLIAAVDEWFAKNTGLGGCSDKDVQELQAIFAADRAARALEDSVTAPAGGAVSAPVFAFRRKGLDDFCTCTEERYAELSAKPNLFETRIFYTTPPAQAADSVLEDAARLERERICAAIKAEDDYCVDQGDYMLDSDDCIKIVRGEWVRPDFTVDAARKKGANHD